MGYAPADLDTYLGRMFTQYSLRLCIWSRTRDPRMRRKPIRISPPTRRDVRTGFGLRNRITVLSSRITLVSWKWPARALTDMQRISQNKHARSLSRLEIKIAWSVFALNGTTLRDGTSASLLVFDTLPRLAVSDLDQAAPLRNDRRVTSMQIAREEAERQIVLRRLS
jgi:hypothetical protein